MSDHDLMIDELTSRCNMARESLYTIGWRTYRDGGLLRRNADPHMVVGFNDARHRVEALRDRIDWSAEIKYDNGVIDEVCGFRRAETDRDSSPN